YGPTLGPLVVAASAFRIPETLLDAGPLRGRPAGSAPGAEADGEAGTPDLWKLLSRSTARRPEDGRVEVEDSKKLYQPGKGIRRLEEGALTFLQVCDGRLPAGFRSLVERLTGKPGGSRYLDLYPWYRGRDLALPAEAFPSQVRRAAGRVAEELRERGIEVLGIRAIPMEVLEFNHSLERRRNKSQVSFLSVGSLLRRLWATYPAERIVVMVDRQGGRRRYGPLLFEQVRPRGLRIVKESEEISSYDLLRDGPSLRAAFAVDCEGRCFPVALASMFCKYLRELHMSIFNRFWGEQVERLRGTAGYATDARRFLADIAGARRALEVDDAALIRRR
ncbi:MAG: hypothetical protein ACRD2T_07540, partial [Thermoanaerobaculia bacterium]